MGPPGAITASDLLEWQYLVFAIPLSMTVLLGLVSAMGLLGSGDGEAAHDTDHDADHDAGHDADHDAGHDADDHGHHDSHAHHGGVLADAASLIGLGRAPLTVVLISLFGLFGLTGLVVHYVLEDAVGRGALSFAGAFASAVAASVAGTRAISTAVGRVLPRDETYAMRNVDFAGLVGSAETRITETFGLVRVKDGVGTIHQLRSKSAPGADIERGAPVLVVDFDREQGVFLVRAAPPELAGRTQGEPE